MKDIIIETLFGRLSFTLSEPDPETGKRGGVLDYTELQRETDAADDALDTLEALVLAHACAGVDVESAAYIEGLEATLEAIDNNS